MAIGALDSEYNNHSHVSIYYLDDERRRGKVCRSRMRRSHQCTCGHYISSRGAIRVGTGHRDFFDGCEGGDHRDRSKSPPGGSDFYTRVYDVRAR